MGRDSETSPPPPRDPDRLSRRKLLEYGLAAGAALYGLAWLGAAGRTSRRALKQRREAALESGLAVARGEDPAALTRAAVEALGGMAKLVRKGDVVVIKPNMAWERGPEFAANTNPAVVAELVRLCRAAGAARVKVFDHPPSANPRERYEISGIAQAAEAAGADVHLVRPAGFVELPIPDGALKSWPFYEEVVFADEVDVLINVPIAKHHSTSRLTMAIKNVMGMVGGNRGALHQNLHRNLADLNRVVRVDLTVLDAYRLMLRHGPTGGRLEDVDNSPEHARRVIVSTDPVAVDAYGATLFGLKPDEIGFINESCAAGLGVMDLSQVKLREVSV